MARRSVRSVPAAGTLVLLPATVQTHRPADLAPYLHAPLFFLCSVWRPEPYMRGTLHTKLFRPPSTKSTGTNGDMVEAVTFTPDGRSLVSGSSDATIRAWDVETALNLASEANHDPLARLGSATLTDNGWLVGSSGELLLWLPPKYRGHIPLPPCSMIIGSYPVQLQVDEAIGGLHWGDEWTKCWRGTAHPAARPFL